MTELLTAAQMRAIEAAAIASGEVTGLELMERAGRGVVEAIFEEWPDLRGGAQRAVVLCGPGNNGGDGFVVARLLHDLGWGVEAFLYGDAAKLPTDARVNYVRWRERGAVQVLSHPVATPPETEAFREAASHLPDQKHAPDLTELPPFVVVDALFGIGLTRPISGLDDVLGHMDYLAAWRDLNNSRLVAIDIPSGLDADTGTGLGSAPFNVICADLTITFHAPKSGHMLVAGSSFCGHLVTKDIGLRHSPQSPGADGGCPAVPPVETVRLLDRDTARRAAKHSGHKCTHGHALVLSGPANGTGAARLAARAALRIGAGLVTVGSPPDALAENAAHLTAIMLKRIDGADGLADALQDTRINALCLGPGLGVDRARDLAPVALTRDDLAVVLDADGLSAFEDNPEALFAMLHDKCVLTPHGGEFRRLFPDIHARLAAPAAKGSAYSKVDATRAAAARAGCVVLLKGPDTVIAAPNGRASINSAQYDRAAPWLATAGSGDVLAGFITGLLARGCDPMQAAETAAWLHVECARSFGPGLIAEDLPEQLPKVLAALNR